jgi:hypothetical protein
MFPNDFQSYFRSIISSNLYKKKAQNVEKNKKKMNEIYIDEGKNHSSSLSDYNNNEGAEQE